MRRGPTNSRTAWSVGDRLVHPADPALGVGVIQAIEGRFLDVFFRDADRSVRLTTEIALERFQLRPGQTVSLESSDERVRIAGVDGDDLRLDDGRVVRADAVWPVVISRSPLDRLASGQVDSVAAFRNRVDGLRLIELREAGGLGSFLGARIDLYPHQLHTALQAVRGESVRWLLADEVGLGKTIEAGLILSALVRTGRARRAIVVAPDTLAVQWLGELYRKFHQVFTLLDPRRLESTGWEFGEGFNPFVAHRNAVVSIEQLCTTPGLVEHALACEPDLLVVDEAHRLCTPELLGRLGPLVRRARHALLLTATPLAADLPGFHQLLDLLHPGAFESYAAFEEAIARGTAVLPCTSVVQRTDLGGLPPRVPHPVDLPPETDTPATDPRAEWIAEHMPGWRARGQKSLVFVSQLEELEALGAHLRQLTGEPLSVFHEKLDLEQRDVRLARFQEGDESVLLCSEAGGEGRNFQFCERMVHYDLPRDPIRLEQRIGRLDRIGRKHPVEIVYFRCANRRPDTARLYERLRLFETPSAGIDAALAGVRQAIERAVRMDRALDVDALERAVSEARDSAARAAPRAFYPDAYDKSQAKAVLDLVPKDLEQATKRYCVEAARQLGLKVVQKAGAARYYMELSAPAGRPDYGADRASELRTADWETMLTRVDSLPGVRIHALPGYGNEVRFLGTFDRAEAIQHQSLAFFASGQMLAEGLIAELEDSDRGRAALFQITGTAMPGRGLLCLYRERTRLRARAIDSSGEPRAGWAEVLLRSLDRAVHLPLPSGDARERWSDSIQQLGRICRQRASGELVAAAFFVAT